MRQERAQRDEDILNLVIEYSDYVARDQFIKMDRSQFDDGRHRIFVHPSHREVIDRGLAEVRLRRNTP